MTKTDFKSVDEYIAAQTQAVRGVLGRVRSAIRESMPGAQEVISYKIPTYKLHGKSVLYFAGWKQHYSLYPVGAHIATAFKKELAPYEVDRGTIRFPLCAPVPVKLIRRIANFRTKEAAEREKAKRTAPKKRKVHGARVSY
jgi:uncharacterized protein YdhG (YjbR/CyaY superfamily)